MPLLRKLKYLQGFRADFACFPPADCGFHLRFPFYPQSTSVLNSSPLGDSFGALNRQPVFVPLRCYTCVLTFLAKFSTVFACPGPSRPSLSVISTPELRTYDMMNTKYYTCTPQKWILPLLQKLNYLRGFRDDFACFPPAGCGFHLRFPFYPQSTSVLNSSPFGDSFGALNRQPVFVPLCCYICPCFFGKMHVYNT